MSDVKITKNEVATWLADMPSRYKQIGGQFKKLVVNSSTKLQKKAPKGGTSNLVNSIPPFTETNINGLQMSGKIGTNIPYAMVAMATGRKPGGKLIDASAGSALDRWAKSKGLNAYAVAKKIQQKGTRRWRSKINLVEQVENEINNKDVPTFLNKISEIIIK